MLEERRKLSVWRSGQGAPTDLPSGQPLPLGAVLKESKISLYRIVLKTSSPAPWVSTLWVDPKRWG